MDEHPLIRFADGPAGRRARLAGTGKDIWEVIGQQHWSTVHVADLVATTSPRSCCSIAARARAELGWSPVHPTLIEEFRDGSYRK